MTTLKADGTADAWVQPRWRLAVLPCKRRILTEDTRGLCALWEALLQPLPPLPPALSSLPSPPPRVVSHRGRGVRLQRGAAASAAV